MTRPAELPASAALFKAWIVGKPLPPGVSAAAWKVIAEPGGSVLVACAKRSHGADSTGNRGVVAAAWGVLQSLPQGASVTIRSNLKHVVDGINGDAAHWQKKGFREKDGKPRKNADLWGKFLEVRDAKNIDARAEHVSKGRSKEDDTIYRELEALAYDEAKAKQAELIDKEE